MALSLQDPAFLQRYLTWQEPPFIIAIDWFINRLNFSNVYALVRSLPALLVLVMLILFTTNANLIFIYGFFIVLDIITVVAFFTIGEYIPTLQDVIATMDRKVLLVDALMLYQGLLFIIGVDVWLVKSASKRMSLILLAAFTGILCKLNYGFVLGFWFFMASEAFGVHKKLKQSFQETFYLANNFGYLNTIIFYYRSKKISLVLRLFWLCAFVIKFLQEVDAKFNLYWFLICTAAVSTTHLRLFALALWLPEISYMVLWIARGILKWSVRHTVDDLEPRDIGKAVIFYFIASFNSVLDAQIIQRVLFIAVMLFISFSYILQSVFNLCDETLKALSTSLQNSYLAHIRAVSLTFSLVCFLLYTSWMFCSLFSFRVWQLVVVSSNVVTAVQALSSLAVYALFIYDLKSLNKLEQLDDWVYYLNAVSKSLEFLSAFLVLSFGLWDVFQGSWSILGLVVIVIHTYHNVWLTARNGWKVFLNRRTAVAKLNRLSDATREQLEGLQDLCAICLESMSSAKITQCGHYFHANCLRKWLYVQSACPLCHQDVLVNDVQQD